MSHCLLVACVLVLPLRSAVIISNVTFLWTTVVDLSKGIPPTVDLKISFSNLWDEKLPVALVFGDGCFRCRVPLQKGNTKRGRKQLKTTGRQSPEAEIPHAFADEVTMRDGTETKRAVLHSTGSGR